MRSIVPEIARSWRENPLPVVGLLGLGVVLVVWLWQLPHFLAGNSEVWPQYATAFYDMLHYTAWGFAAMLLVTALTRTVSLKLLLACWFLGVFAVHGVVIALETPFRDSLGVNGVGVWVAPVVETLAVLLVAVLFYVLATHRRSTHPTVSDGLLVGFATGAGLGFHEEMTYGRLTPIGPGAEYSTVNNAGQDIWWSYVVPLVGWQGQFNIRQFGNGVAGNFTLYHAGWGTLLGVGVGFAYVHRHHILAWLAGLAAVAVTYFEHFSGNWGVWKPQEPAPVVGDLFQAGDAYGVSELAIYVLLVAIAAAVLADLVVVRRTARQLDGFFPAVYSGFPSGAGSRDDSSSRNGGVLGVVRRLRALDEYARFRRALMVEIHRVQQTRGDPTPLGPTSMALYETGRRAKLFGSVGVCLVTVLATLGFLASSGAATARRATHRTLSCAGCAPPSRFMETAPYVVGAVFAAVAVYAAIRRPVAVSRRGTSASSSESAPEAGSSGGPRGGGGPRSPPPPPGSSAARSRRTDTDTLTPVSTGTPTQMRAYYDSETGKIVLAGVDKNGDAVNVTGADG